MQAELKNISNIINPVNFISVPIFQRDYVWNESLWSAFLNDIEDLCSIEQEHFFGSIILKTTESTNISGVTNYYKIVDGQQRLTTALIFFKALALVLNNNEIIDNFTYRKTDQNGNQICCLQLGKYDNISLHKIINLTEANIFSDPQNQVECAFNYFINELSSEENKEFYSKKILSQITQKMLFVLIILDEEDDENQIFDTINSLGCKLTCSDLIKNFLFTDEPDLYDLFWKKTFEDTPKIESYWNQDVSKGRTNATNLDTFLQAYFILVSSKKEYEEALNNNLKNIKVKGNVKDLFIQISNLNQSYQLFIEYATTDTLNPKKYLIENLDRYATTFKEIINPEIDNQTLDYNISSKRINFIIFAFQKSTVIPYFLYIQSQVLDPDERLKMYEILESFLLRREICSKGAKNYPKFFRKFIRDEINTAQKLIDALNAQAESQSAFPLDKELKESCVAQKFSNNYKVKAILYLLESRMMGKNASHSLLPFNKYSLEHLMPRKWQDNWNQNQLSEEEIKEREHSIYTIGNLAIINKNLNSAIKNSDWETKVAGKNQDGLKQYASGILTLGSALDKKDWNEETIKERAEWLYEKMLKYWSLHK